MSLGPINTPQTNGPLGTVGRASDLIVETA